MEALYEFGLEATRWLQAMYPQLAGFMQIMSDFGRFELYLAAIPLVYWCINKRLGVHLSYLLVVSTVLNLGFKHIGRQPRPLWLDDSIGLSNAESYGFPSGHVQTATLVFYFLAGWLRESWLWLFATLYVFLMALSRVYLGVHFVHDVVAGFFVALLLLGGYLAWQQFGVRRFKQRIFGQRLLFAAVLPLALLIVYVAIIFLRGEPDASLPWASHFELAELESFEGTIQFIAVMLGAGVGFTFEQTRVCFKVEGVWWKRLLRYVIGLIGILLIWRGLGVVFGAIAPDELLWLSLPLRFIRYTLLGLWLAYYAPMLFVMLNLTDHAVEPEIPFTVEGATMRKREE